MRQGSLDGLIETLDPHGGSNQCVEQAGHAGAAGSNMRQHRFADVGEATVIGGDPGCQHGAAGVGLTQGRQRALGRLRAVDHDRCERFTERGLDGGLPTGVDLDQVEQGAEHTVDVGEPLGSGPSVSRIERHLQCFDPGAGTRGRLRRVVTLCGASLERSIRRGTVLLGPLDLFDERALYRLGPGTVVTELLGLDDELPEFASQLVGAGRGATQIVLGALGSGAYRPQLTTDFGGGAGRLRSPVVGGQGVGDARALVTKRLFLGGQRLTVRCDLLDRDDDLVQLAAESGDVRFQIGDDALTEQLTMIAFERAFAFGQDAGQAAGTLAELLDLHQPVADVVFATRRQLGLDRHDLGVELGELGLHVGFEPHGIDAVGGDHLEFGAQPADLATGDIHP